MASTKVNQNKKTSGEYDAPGMGTWISVGVVFGVILVTYIVLFGLYMARV